MKKINKAYLATERDSSMTKIMAELPENPGGYSAVFTSLEQKFAEKALKALSETEEDAHPSMFIPLSFIFRKPPFLAAQKLQTEVKGKKLYEIVIADFLMHTYEWLFVNEQLILELFSLCPELQLEDLGHEQTLVRNIHITPEIENAFLAGAKSRQEHIKRTKILAGVNATLTHQSLVAAVEQNDAQATAEYMFLFTRSMAQFAAHKSVDDGLNRQAARRKGGSRVADRTGLFAFIQSYHQKNPRLSDSALWKLIRKDLLQRKKVKPCAGYSVKFYPEPTDTSDTAGLLIQKKSKGKEYPIGFEAFRNIRSEVRK